MMRKYGVIGFPAKHSFSPQYFKEKFQREGIQEAEYYYYEISDINDLNLIIDLGIIGLNVTSPYKEKIIEFCDDLDPSAKEIKAANTIKITDNKLIGFNTDIYGFKMSILKEKEYLTSDKCLVLGTGGAARAVEIALNELGIDVTYISRKNKYLRYDQLTKEIVSKHKLIVNATPLGMGSNMNEIPDFPLEFLNSTHFVYDLIYNPEKTVFLSEAEKRGAHIKNGYDMLKYQAEKSWEIWNQ